MIRAATSQDAEAIAAIYNWYIENTVITFEEIAITSAQMASRIASENDHCPWIIMEEAGQILGYAYVDLWGARPGYRLSRETTVYLHKDAAGAGRGLALYQYLIDKLRETPIHVLIAGIALPNAASVALHEKLGFQKVAHFQEVGRKFEKTIDVGYWQLQL